MNQLYRWIFVAALLAIAASAVIPVTASAASIPLAAVMTGSQETPPNSSRAVGFTFMTYDTATMTFNLDSVVEGMTVSRLTESHIHEGAPGVAGPIIVDLDGPASWVQGPDQIIRLVLRNMAFPAEFQSQLLSGNTYMNVHTIQLPEGEIRGQLIPIPDASTLAYAGLALAPAILTFRRRLIR